MVIVGRRRHFPGRSTVMVIMESIVQTEVEVIRVPTGTATHWGNGTTSNGSRLGATGPLLELFIQCLDALVQ